MKKLLFLLAVFLAGSFADAATFTVTTDADSGTGSLRVALTSANSTAGTDTIAFSAFFSTARTITLASALPAISDDVAINGPGSSLLTISGNSQFRILSVAAGKRVTISQVKFSGGRVSNTSSVSADMSGGAITNAGTLTVSDCIFAGNAALTNSGGGGGKASGGAIASSVSLEVINCTFSSNGAYPASGTGLGAGGKGFGGAISSTGSLVVIGSTFSGNSVVCGLNYGSPSSEGNGGAIHSETGSATILNCTFSNNSSQGGWGYDGGPPPNSGGSGPGASGGGGAIYLQSGTMTIADTTFTGNTSKGGARGVPRNGFTPAGGAAFGGAVCRNNGNLSIDRCSFSTNSALSDSSSGPGYGGAISGICTLANCTISQNSASGTGSTGGGISASAGTILHCTIAGNSAASAGGVTFGPSLKNTLVSGNSPAAGSVNSLGYNLFETSAGISGLVASDLRDVAPLIGPLQGNGGPTQTRALLANSPAVNAGDNTGAPATDQRGEARPQGATVDIGAFEASALTIFVDGNPTQAGAYAPPRTVTVSFETVFPVGAIRYTLDGSTPNLSSTPYTSPFPMAVTGTIRAVAFDQTFANPVFAGPVQLSFTPLRTLTLNILGQGTVTLDPPGGIYHEGEVVKLTAIAPSSGWAFDGWSGDSSGTASPTNLSINANKSVTASFRADPHAAFIPGLGTPDGFFGAFGSVAISGPLLFVGARGENKVYEYVLGSSGSTVPFATFNNPDPVVGNSYGFGFSVAMSGTRLVVGSPLDSTGGVNRGSAYVYDLNSTTPTVPIVTLRNPSATSSSQFAYSVAMTGTYLVVGARSDSTGAIYAGSVFVYDLRSATPTIPIRTFNNPTPASIDYFGSSVAISGTRIVVGTPKDDTPYTDVGIAYVYDLGSATPTAPIFTLNNPASASYGEFGSSVAISGTRVVVGAPGNGTNQGSAYVYDLGSATPTAPITFNNPSPVAGKDAYFGYSVAINGTRVIVGADRAYTGTIDRGGAYLYELSSATPAVPVTTYNNPGLVTGGYFGSVVAIDTGTVVIGQKYSAAVYTYGIIVPNDADGDGLRDTWELLYWPTTAGHGPNDDFDHDGFTNLQELAFGLNPLVPDAGSVPKPILEGGYLTLTLTKQPWITYEVQSAGTLLPGQPESFSSATATILINNSTTLKVRDKFLFGTQPGRFMRVRVLAAP